MQHEQGTTASLTQNQFDTLIKNANTPTVTLTTTKDFTIPELGIRYDMVTKQFLKIP